MSARSRWARRLIKAAAKPLPRYGDEEWLALPEGDARKIAAVVVAAECWASELDDLEVVVRLEFDAFKRAEDADYQARAAAHREEWSRVRHGAQRRYDTATAYRRALYGANYGRSA